MQSTVRIGAWLLTAVCLLACSLPVFASGTAKDMFYQELKGSDSSGSTSVAYCLELHRGTAPPTLCNNRYSFSSGDGIRLHVKTTASSYAYIALAGSSGKKSILYPASAEDDNRVEPNKEVLVPPKGMIVFDNNPGTEQLFVILSPQPLDMSRDLNTAGAAAIAGDDVLSGLPVKVGNYQVMSEDGFYDLGEKTPGSGLVYITNPNPDKPTIIALALSHGGGGDQGSAANSGQSPGTQSRPGASPIAPIAAGAALRTQYYVTALHNDGNSQLQETDEISIAFKKVASRRKSGIDCGARDQYTAGLNHIYANFYDQQVQAPGGRVYYSQEKQNLRRGDTGERLRSPTFSGSALPDDRQPDCSPGPTATFDGIAYIEECLSQGKANLVGGSVLARLWKDPKIYVISNGKDLDAAWDSNSGGPLIIGVDCRANMFGDKGSRFAGHVVVLSERREMNQGNASSNREYRLLNSWGLDNDGRVRNGWVSADAVASAMNYTDAAHDQSVEPQRALEKDALPQPGDNEYAHGDDGLKAGLDEWGRGLTLPQWQANSSRSANFDLDNDGDANSRGLFGKKSKNGGGNDLLKFVADGKEGLSPEERSIIENSVSELLSNKTDNGPRKYPLSNTQIQGILHEASRLFTESNKIYAQGLDQGDRNRALVALLHDNANPEHINQGGHNTCNVTTIMKIETMMRPAAQAKRFVDMYTNANGDQTVNVP